MPLFKITWKLATSLALYSGEYIVIADDSDHAIDRAKIAIGPEARAAQIGVEEIGTWFVELKRNETLVDADVYAPLPGGSTGELFAFELAARANVIASTEKKAFDRMAQAIRAGQSDGKYCTLFKAAVLEREPIDGMSRRDRHALHTNFIRVSGGGVNPR